MIERELKLTAADEQVVNDVLESALILNCCVSNPDADPVVFEAVYYDTDQLDLQAARCGLRARMEGQRMRAALKLPGQIVDGLSERVEHEADLTYWPDSFSDFPEGAFRDALLSLVSIDQPMRERVRVSMARRIRQLRIGDSEVELVADHGMIKGLKGEQPLDEIELELKTGDIAPMLELGSQLKTRYSLQYSEKTKLGIGLSLC